MASIPIDEDPKVQDLKKKISLIKTVILRCEKLMTNPVNLMNPSNATTYLTKQSPKTIEEAIKHPKAEDLTQLYDLKKKVEIDIKQSRITNSHIHRILYKYYVDRRSLFDKETLKKELGTADINENIVSIVKAAGFVWKEIGNDGRCILVEDPEVQAKRIKYFLDMKRFREEKRTIVYIAHKAIPADAETLSRFRAGYQLETDRNYGHVKLAASPQLGVLGLSVNKYAQSLSDWFTKEIALQLRPSSVLVIEEDIFKETPIDAPPGPQAKKSEMLNWLERNGIPCNNTMHRAHLYELIELCKDRFEVKYLSEEIIKNRGIEIVKKPKDWPELDYFESVWSMSALWQDVVSGSVDAALEGRLNMALNISSLSTWTQYDFNLAIKEYRHFEKDMELEEVIDRVLTFYKDTPMSLIYCNLPHVSEVKETPEQRILAKFSGSW